MTQSSWNSISEDVILGVGVKLTKFLNLYGCKIGDYTKIGTFVEIQKGAEIGKKCKISSHSFICEGVKIGDETFIGHGVMFINDNYPRAAREDGKLEEPQDWLHRFKETLIEDQVTIGSGCTILGGVRIGKGALIGAGSVVTKDVPPNEIWAGNPARFLRKKA